MLVRIYRKLGAMEACFYVEVTSALTDKEWEALSWLAAETFEPDQIRPISFFRDREVVEIGPRLNVETPFSSNAVAICHAMGLKKVTRVERAMRYPLGEGVTREAILAEHLDRMTQAEYSHGISSLDSGLKPEPVRVVPILERGEEALREFNAQAGGGMDAWCLAHFAKVLRSYGCNPTDAAVFYLFNSLSEHCRHWFVKGRLVIDGVEMLLSILDLIQAPLNRLGADHNSVLAFNDNAGAIRGYKARVLLPCRPGEPSGFRLVEVECDATGTAETHNHPTLISPYEGGGTGPGGRIRDVTAVGRGGTPRIGLFGIFVGNLWLPDFIIPGEVVGGEDLVKYASPLKILIQGSNGALGYGNRFGEPTVGGFTRSFGLMVGGERIETIKPILYTAGLGVINHNHTQKPDLEPGMLVIRIGGPAYRVGVGGGSASSMMHGANDAELDFQSVQRGNPEMENRANRVFRACVEMGDQNPIVNTNDQGAGGPSNALTELAGKLGARIDVRQIVVGDKTMSVLEIWSAEFQEGYGLVVRRERLADLQKICQRERVNCEVVGEITGDGRIVVVDSENGQTVVDLVLDEVLTGIPRKTFQLERVPRQLEPLKLPENLTVRDAFQKVLTLPQVGSKGFLVHKVDRSVTGLVARQQCCGPTQVPVADVAVTADSHFSLTGAAAAIGEQPNIMLVNPAAGARMAVAEMLTNLAAAQVSGLKDISCRANWMWPAKLPGEGARLYDAASALSEALIALGLKIDGGKDSLSMAATVRGEIVKSPGQLVLFGYAPVPDITRVLTPDLKRQQESVVCLIDLGQGRNRLGGSSLAQAFGQVGNEAPDIDPEFMQRAFLAQQELLDQDLLLSYHDRSAGGLIIALAEMCLAGDCGLKIRLGSGDDPLSFLFTEEAGMIFECKPERLWEIRKILQRWNLDFVKLSRTDGSDLAICHGGQEIFREDLGIIRTWWEATSSRLDKEQASMETVISEWNSFPSCRRLEYDLRFTPEPSPEEFLERPKVAVLREEGTNGDREMAAAFYMAGLAPYDITMSDLLAGRISLDEFRGLVFPGGFSFMDTLDSAKGWAGVIRFNSKLREMFDRFYERSDTFSLGVCNGCQLMALLGWVPFRGLAETSQPRFIRNLSGRFESRWLTVKVLPSPSILLRGMENSTLGVWVAHGEGRLVFPDRKIAEHVHEKGLAPLAYVDQKGLLTDEYPSNPNGSPLGWTALCSPDGRHLALMPHPERCFLKWQWAWMPEDWKRSLEASPWLRMFQNARDWCLAR